MNVEEGSVGAGTGATVASTRDPKAEMKGGLGTASARDRRNRRVVGALVVCNAVGDVVDDDGSIIAGLAHRA